VTCTLVPAKDPRKYSETNEARLLTMRAVFSTATETYHCARVSTRPHIHTLHTGCGDTGCECFTISLVRIDRPFVLRLHFIAIPPLPVVVAVVVDLFDGDRRF